jgi:hypothetical protein
MSKFLITFGIYCYNYKSDKQTVKMILDDRKIKSLLLQVHSILLSFKILIFLSHQIIVDLT